MSAYFSVTQMSMLNNKSLRIFFFKIAFLYKVVKNFLEIITLIKLIYHFRCKRHSIHPINTMH